MYQSTPYSCGEVPSVEGRVVATDVAEVAVARVTMSFTGCGKADTLTLQCMALTSMRGKDRESWSSFYYLSHDDFHPRSFQHYSTAYANAFP